MHTSSLSCLDPAVCSQVTASTIVLTHAEEYQGITARPILPLPELVSRRYDSIKGHIHWAQNGFTDAEAAEPTTSSVKACPSKRLLPACPSQD